MVMDFTNVHILRFETVVNYIHLCTIAEMEGEVWASCLVIRA